MDVDDEHGDDDGEGDEDHDEQQVLSNQRDHLGNQSEAPVSRVAPPWILLLLHHSAAVLSSDVNSLQLLCTFSSPLIAC